MDLHQSVRLQRRIQLFAVIGIFSTGLLVAIATGWPIYRHAHELVATSLQDKARIQAQLLSQFLGQARDVSAQFASRSGIRDMLEEYNAGRVGIEDLARYSGPRLHDALDQASNVVGMVRFDAAGYPVLAYGEAIPADYLRQPDPNLSDVSVGGPFMSGNMPFFLVSAPIVSREGARVGTDVLAFDFGPLGRQLASTLETDTRARQLLFDSARGALVELGRGRDPPLLSDGRGSEYERLLLRAAAGDTGVERVSRAYGRSVIVAFANVGEMPGWGFAFINPARELDLPVLSRLVAPLVALVVLVLAGAALTAVAIRPVAQRVLEQSRQLAAMSEGRALAASVFEGSPQGVLILDRNRTIIEANPATALITGFDLADLRGHTLCESLGAAGEQDAFWHTVWERVDSLGEWQGEAHFRRCDGSTFPAWHSVSPVCDGDDVVHHYIAMFSDISDKKFAEDRIRHLAHHDPLTDLPNRTLFADRLAHALERARRGRLRLALLFVDLDRFKNVNDSLGHPIGDCLLQTVAGRLDQVVRDEDTLARFGGDEFVVMVENLPDPDSAARVARKLIAALDAPVIVGTHEIFVGASVGISVFPDDGDTSEMLLQNADSAMYEAKASGRSTYRFYTTEQTRVSRERFELEGGLRRALERDELRVFFQPQAACGDGRLTGVEALVRWQHPERGLVPPDSFIPIAEDTGLVVPIGAWVLETACRWGRTWELEGHPLRVAVNLSGQQLSTGDFEETVRTILQRTGFSPELLELEITEGHLMKRIEESITALNRLKSLGVTIAIDDFGTGYSSLSYLKKLPADRLKIDRTFVEGVPNDPDDVAIVATILAMSRNLGLAVIAEGVESAVQLDHLVSAACGEYQGYLLARPMPGEHVGAWIEARQSRVIPAWLERTLSI